VKDTTPFRVAPEDEGSGVGEGEGGGGGDGGTSCFDLFFTSFPNMSYVAKPSGRETRTTTPNAQTRPPRPDLAGGPGVWWGGCAAHQDQRSKG
jgi:hypothetical protein